MPNNLGEIDNIRIMRHNLTSIVNAYRHVRGFAKNETLEGLLEYHDSLVVLQKNLEKKFEDLKPK